MPNAKATSKMRAYEKYNGKNPVIGFRVTKEEFEALDAIRKRERTNWKSMMLRPIYSSDVSDGSPEAFGP